MRHFFTLLAVCFLVPQAAPLLAADSLFSQVPIQSVFAPSEAPAAANSGAEKPAAPPLNFGAKKPFAVGQMSELLHDAGFETKELAERTFATKTKVDNWSFPIIVTVSEDQKQLWVVLMLSVVKDEKQIPVDKLLALMSANRQYAPAYFSYSTTHKRTELYRSFNSLEVTSDLLKEEINRLASIAKETRSLWDFTTLPAATTGSDAIPAPAPAPTKAPSTTLVSTPSTSSAAGTAQPPVAAAPATSLVGQWSASPAEKEAFAMQFDADGKFILVHINQGKQTRSTGKYTQDKQTLTLIGEDGTQLSGTISSQTAQDFTLKLQTKAEKPTVLTFRKSK